MLALMEPLKPALDADEAATTFEVTYTPDAQGNGTIQIPVSISSDGESLAVKCPPVAIPIGTWILDWVFTLDSNVPPVSIAISQLMSIQDCLSVTSQQTGPVQSSSQTTTLSATVVNQLLPPSQSPQSFNVWGYWIQVNQVETAPGSASLNPVLHNSSLAVVQDQILADAAGPPSFTLTYSLHPLNPSLENPNVLTIPVFVSLPSDSTSFAVKSSPAALPIGYWQIVWDFNFVGIAAEDVGIEFLKIPGNVNNYFNLETPPRKKSSTSWECSGKNIIPNPLDPSIKNTPPVVFSEMIFAFGYSIQVSDARTMPAGGRAISTTVHDPSIAVVQDPIVG